MRCHYCGWEGEPGDQVHVAWKRGRGLAVGFVYHTYKYVCDNIDNCNRRLVETKKAAILKTDKERNVHSKIA